nr:hypothetical protein [Streptomyces sp. GESEQ-4]
MEISEVFDDADVNASAVPAQHALGAGFVAAGLFPQPLGFFHAEAAGLGVGGDHVKVLRHTAPGCGTRESVRAVLRTGGNLVVRQAGRFASRTEPGRQRVQ